MSVPDVLGLRLEDALGILTDEGWESAVVTTYPPRRTNIVETSLRVLRVTATGERSVELVVAYEGAGEGCSGRRSVLEPGL